MLSALPLLSGLVTGVVKVFKHYSKEKILVSAAIKHLKLSLCHSIIFGLVTFDPNRFFTACIIKSPTKPASMPMLLATQPCFLYRSSPLQMPL
jgi:hypothetical protein